MRKRPLSKSDAIRQSIREAGRPLNIYELMERMEAKLKSIVSKPRLYVQLGMMQTAGEIVPSGKGEKRKYALRVGA